MEGIKTNLTVDAKGLACPMPIIRTKKAINELNAGEVLEILATDKGSKPDLQAWSKSSGHQYLGTIEDGAVLKHYVRKASSDEEKEETKHPVTIANDELLQKLESGEEVSILDVREPAEYAFGHLPGSISIPFGELEMRMNEVNKNVPIYVVCRTGNRSDMACQLLSEQGYSKVINVLPGMSDWNGPKQSAN